MGDAGAGEAVWTTADYALVVSLCSAAIALISLGWNIWSKFIHPKPKVRVKLQFAYPVSVQGELGREVADLSITNHGPGSIKINQATGKISGFGNRHKRILLPGYQNWPSSHQMDVVAGASKMPMRLDQGDTFQVYFPVEVLKANNIKSVGFADSFDRETFVATRGRGLSGSLRGGA